MCRGRLSPYGMSLPSPQDPGIYAEVEVDNLKEPGMVMAPRKERLLDTAGLIQIETHGVWQRVQGQARHRPRHKEREADIKCREKRCAVGSWWERGRKTQFSLMEWYWVCQLHSMAGLVLRDSWPMQIQTVVVVVVVACVCVWFLVFLFRGEK